MSYQSERDEFLSIMGAEGIRPEVARALLRESTTLQRLGELECSSERADRDQVRCPAGRLGAKVSAACLCKDYGSYGQAETRARKAALSRFPRMAHGKVPRHLVKSDACMARVRKLWETLGERYTTGLKVHFGGDPRGCMLVVSVPSGRTNDWERRGIAVPSRGYTAAQMDRISR